MDRRLARYLDRSYLGTERQLVFDHPTYNEVEVMLYHSLPFL